MQDNGGVKTDNFNFTDPYDPRTGVLVCPDIALHLDLYQASFLVGVLIIFVCTKKNSDTAVFHYFRSAIHPHEDNFTPTTRQCHGKSANVELTESMREVMNFHYKHSIITSWGGTCLQSFLRDFPTAGGVKVARSMDQDDDFSLSPPPSADYFDLWE